MSYNEYTYQGFNTMFLGVFFLIARNALSFEWASIGKNHLTIKVSFGGHITITITYEDLLLDVNVVKLSVSPHVPYNGNSLK